MNPVMGDFEANLEKLQDIMERARQSEADLVICPELALCGYPPEDLLLKPHFLENNDRALKSLLKQVRGLTAIVGFAQAGGPRAYNAAAVIDDQCLLGVYHKIELPNYGVFDEKRYFTPGVRPLIFEWGGLRMTVTICEDIWVQGGPVESCLGGQSVDLILNISASPFHAGKVDLRRHILSKFAQRVSAPIAYVNTVGGQDELVFDGASLVMDAQGKLLCSAPHFKEALLIADLDFPVRTPPADTFFDFRIPRPLHAHTVKIQPQPVPAMGRQEEIFSALVLGTRDYVRKNGFSKVVLGMSGGIDSALTAVIAAEALGAENVTAISMPSPFSSAETQADAEQVARILGLSFYTVTIAPILSAYQEILEPSFGRGPGGLADENLQARIRGNILMYFSNYYGWLVLTTGNKSENAVGYCTLYGDMAGGFAVIKDVPKMLVYELANYINQRPGGARIPQSVIDRVPTAELRPNQKDEDSLPPYPVLDAILKAYVEEDKDPEEIIARGLDRTMVMDVAAMVDRSEYKRRQAPPGVKITPKAFGRDRRLPITNRYRPAAKKRNHD
jgi:NAD+ synthase (glutamine-hydrolysing)